MDKTFKRQLEKFGTEQYQAIEPDIQRKQRQTQFEATLDITRALMSTMEGRQWAYNKLDFYCVNSTPFVPNDPYATAFLCGLQEAGHQLQGEILLACPNEYSLMLQEAAARIQPAQEKKES